MKTLNQIINLPRHLFLKQGFKTRREFCNFVINLRTSRFNNLNNNLVSTTPAWLRFKNKKIKFAETCHASNILEPFWMRNDQYFSEVSKIEKEYKNFKLRSK